jgi:transcriptional regulator with XRE-family HTH domain
VAGVKLGPALRLLRAAHGMTQAELAALVGVSESSVCLWENGYRNPRIARLEVIAAAFGIEPSTLTAMMVLDLRHLVSDTAIVRALDKVRHIQVIAPARA